MSADIQVSRAICGRQKLDGLAFLRFSWARPIAQRILDLPEECERADGFTRSREGNAKEAGAQD